MKFWLVLFITFVLVACATTSTRTNKLTIGMSRTQVEQIMGTPASTAANEKGFQLHYRLSTPSRGIGYLNEKQWYVVGFKDDKVVSYGWYSDNNQSSTESTTVGSTAFKLNKDAFGPGIHMDEYGRAVKVTPYSGM